MNSNHEDFPLLEATVAQLQAWQADGTYTARQLVQLYLDRIEQIDPLINAVIDVNPDALAIADALDAEREAGNVRGPLHGIPVLVKANIDSADKLPTTAGSLALKGNIAPRDAHVVAQLRSAGAVLLGKTNLSEWANFRGKRSSSGWSSLGGQTRNPYALDRTPSGSSSGSGAATSANLCAVSIGTETDGSIISPSNASGLVGIKPTVGLVSRGGIIPISHSQDTAGPMCRTVADAALVLTAIAGKDKRDSITSRYQPEQNYGDFLNKNGLRGARIGFPKQFRGKHTHVDALMATTVQSLREAGATVIDDCDINAPDHIGADEYQVLVSEYKAGLDAYFATLAKSDIQSVEDVIAFNRANRDVVMPYFEQQHLGAATQTGLDDPAYLAARARNLATTRTSIDTLLAEHELDAIMAPSGGPAWLIDWVNGDNFSVGNSSWAAISGYPSITVPAGLIFGLPVGVSFFASAWAEPRLIELAYSFEQATRCRKPPQFLPTVAFGEA